MLGSQTPTYVPLDMPDHVDALLRSYLATRIEAAFREAHWMISNRVELTRHQTGLAMSLAMLLLTQADGISNVMFEPDRDDLSSSARFRGMFLKLYPWAVDSAKPRSVAGRRSLVVKLYNSYRNPFVHRSGLSHRGPHAKIQFTLKSPSGIDQLAVAPRPIRPLIEVHDDRFLLNLDTLYWGLRRIVEALIRDSEQCRQIEKRIVEGRYEPKPDELCSIEELRRRYKKARPKSSLMR